MWNAIFTYSRSGADLPLSNLRDVEGAIRAQRARQGYRGILQNFLGKASIGVYQNLYRFFSKQEVDAILRRPDHSIGQADYAISLKDTAGGCDDKLREDVRTMFRLARPRNGP